MAYIYYRVSYEFFYIASHNVCSSKTCMACVGLVVSFNFQKNKPLTTCASRKWPKSQMEENFLKISKHVKPSENLQYKSNIITHNKFKDVRRRKLGQRTWKTYVNKVQDASTKE